MLIVSCYLIFLLSLSKPDRCEARHIWARRKGDFAAEIFHAKLEHVSVVEKVDQLQMDKTNNDELITKRDSSANADQEDTKKYLRRDTSGMRELFESLYHVGLLNKATQLKEPKRRELLVKEGVDLNTNSSASNKVDYHDHVDYDPPHGTPPIHNKET